MLQEKATAVPCGRWWNSALNREESGASVQYAPHRDRAIGEGVFRCGYAEDFTIGTKKIPPQAMNLQGE